MNTATDNLFLSNPDPMWIFDLETLRFLAVNNAAVTKYGYSRDEFLAMTIADIRPDEDQPALKEKIATLVKGRNEVGVWRHRLKSGEIIYADITGHTLTHEGRSSILISSQNVSRLVIAERTAQQALARVEAARRSEDAAHQASDKLAQQFRVMFDSVPGMFLVFSPGTLDVVAVSDAYLAAAGHNRSDIVGHNLFGALPQQPKDAAHDGLRSSIERVQDTHSPDLLDVQEFLLPGGRKRYWVTTTTPVKGPDNQLLHIILRMQDVTGAIYVADQETTSLPEFKSSEIDLVAHTHLLKSDNLRLSELATRLRTTQRLLGTGTWDYVIAEDLLIWSDNAYEMYGTTPDQFGHRIEDYFSLVHPDDRGELRTSFENFLRFDDIDFSMAHRVLHPDGRIIHVHGMAEKVETANGPVLRGVVQDITRSVETTRKHTQAKRMLEIAGKSARFGAYHYDVVADKLEWSPQTARIHDEPDGFSPELANGIGYYAPEHRDRVWAMLEACRDEGLPFAETLQIITARGRRVWAHVSGEPERDETGQIIAVQGSFQDVTELVSAHEKANELSNRLADTLENIGDGFLMLDQSWCITYFNKQAELLLERPREGVIDRSLFDEFPGLAGTEFEYQYARAVDTGETVRFEEYFEPLDRTYSVVAHPTPAGLAIYFSDITEKVHQTEQLRLLEAAVQQISDVVIITDATTRDPLDEIVYVNDAFEKVTGFTRDEAIGQTPRILQGPKTQRSELNRIRQAVDKRTPVRAELINYTKSGQEYWLEIEMAPIENKAGTVTHFVAVERDITDRKQADEALRLSETRFRMISKATGSAVWEWDILRDRVWWSDQMAELFGHPQDPESISSTTWRQNISPSDQDHVDDAMDKLLRGEIDAIHDTYRFQRADGTWVDVENRAFLIRDEDGRPVRVLGSITDISHRLEIEERLRQSQKLESVGQLTGGVAHDFNNLLTIILGNVEMLQDSLDEESPLRDFADMTAGAADRAAELTNRLLAFSRKQTLRPEVIDINAVINGIESMLRRTLGEAIDIKVTLDGDLWSSEIDVAQLESSLLNLALNSRDAMPDGGSLTIETSNADLDDNYVVTEPGLNAGDYVVVAVSDTGCGIPKDKIPHIFEPFFTTKAVDQGTGLGLSMVYGFVKQSGGHVRVYSELGEGATVKLYFPRHVGEHVAPNAVAQSQAILRGNETILAVEDDTLILQQLTAQLTGMGYAVLNASAGEPALAILRARPDIDLLFTDIVLPGGMNGRQIAEAALDIRPDLKVLYTSGYSESAIVHDGRLDQDVELLSKPYRRADLATKVRKVLDS